MVPVYSYGGRWGDGQLWGQAPKAENHQWPLYNQRDCWGSPLRSPHPGGLWHPPEGKYCSIVSHLWLHQQTTSKYLTSTLTTSGSLVVATHVFSFLSREEHNWQPRLMPSKHQPGSWFPSSLKKCQRRSKRPERKVTPSFPLFQPSLYLPVNFNSPFWWCKFFFQNWWKMWTWTPSSRRIRPPLLKEEGSLLHELSGSFGTTSNVSVEREKCSLTMSSMTSCSRYIHVFIFISFNPTLIKVWMD